MAVPLRRAHLAGTRRDGQPAVASASPPSRAAVPAQSRSNTPPSGRWPPHSAAPLRYRVFTTPHSVAVNGCQNGRLACKDFLAKVLESAPSVGGGGHRRTTITTCSKNLTVHLKICCGGLRPPHLPLRLPPARGTAVVTLPLVYHKPHPTLVPPGRRVNSYHSRCT